MIKLIGGGYAMAKMHKNNIVFIYVSWAYLNGFQEVN